MLGRSTARGLALTFACAALSAALARSAAADANQVLASTPRAMALAGAYTALSDDASALYYNPAGLGQVDGSNVSLAFMLSFPSLKATDPDGADVALGAPRDEGYGVHLAWSPSSILDGDLGIGFSVLLPHRRALRFNVHTFEDPYFVLYENSIEVLETRVGVAYKVFDFLSVGASALLLAGLDGEVRLVTPFQSGPNLDETKRNVVAVDAVLPNREYFTAGIQLYPTDDLTLGLSFREATFVPIDLPIDFTIEILGLSPIQTVAHLDVKVKYSPAQLGFGAAYRVGPSLLVTGDLQFALYSHYQIPYGNVTLDRSLSDDIVLLPPRKPKTSLRDVWIPRVGVEWLPHELLTLRGGYSWLRSFIRSSDAPIFDSDKHSLCLGLSYALGRLFLPTGNELNLTAATQLLLFVPRTTAGYDHEGHVVSTTFGAEFEY
ncbi:outer membrane protein transport protein [Myxococcota bacterium]|nr:outer membrane protein transport protein [Myxococcota bacterium]